MEIRDIIAYLKHTPENTNPSIVGQLINDYAAEHGHGPGPTPGGTIVDVSDTTATAGDVLSGKVFYANDGSRTVGDFDPSSAPSGYEIIKSVPVRLYNFRSNDEHYYSDTIEFYNPNYYGGHSRSGSSINRYVPKALLYNDYLETRLRIYDELAGAQYNTQANTDSHEYDVWNEFQNYIHWEDMPDNYYSVGNITVYADKNKTINITNQLDTDEYRHKQFIIESVTISQAETEALIAEVLGSIPNYEDVSDQISESKYNGIYANMLQNINEHIKCFNIVMIPVSYNFTLTLTDNFGDTHVYTPLDQNTGYATFIVTPPEGYNITSINLPRDLNYYSQGQEYRVYNVNRNVTGTMELSESTTKTFSLNEEGSVIVLTYNDGQTWEDWKLNPPSDNQMNAEIARFMYFDGDGVLKFDVPDAPPGYGLEMTYRGNPIYAYDSIRSAEYDLKIIQYEVPAESISVEPEFKEVYVGHGYQLGVTMYPQNTTDQPVFESLDENIVTVSSSGYVTAVSVGSTKIRIFAHDGLYDECKVYVNPIPEYDLYEAGTSRYNFNIPYFATSDIVEVGNTLLNSGKFNSVGSSSDDHSEGRVGIVNEENDRYMYFVQLYNSVENATAAYANYLGKVDQLEPIGDLQTRIIKYIAQYGPALVIEQIRYINYEDNHLYESGTSTFNLPLEDYTTIAESVEALEAQGVEINEEDTDENQTYGILNRVDLPIENGIFTDINVMKIENRYNLVNYYDHYKSEIGVETFDSEDEDYIYSWIVTYVATANDMLILESVEVRKPKPKDEGVVEIYSDNYTTTEEEDGGTVYNIITEE